MCQFQNELQIYLISLQGIILVSSLRRFGLHDIYTKKNESSLRLLWLHILRDLDRLSAAWLAEVFSIANFFPLNLVGFCIQLYFYNINFIM
jgi:hypothetical protein